MKKFLLVILKTGFLNSHWSKNLTVSKLDEMTLSSINVTYMEDESNDTLKIVKCNGCDVMFYLNKNGYIKDIDVRESKNSNEKE